MHSFAVRVLRPPLVAAALLVAGVAPGHAATGIYSSGDIALPIPDLAVVESSIAVPDTGPVSDITVRVRLDHSADDDLEISLVAPDGTRVVLASHQGGDAGANFGSGSRDCGGTFTVFDDEIGYRPISDLEAPFAGAALPDEDLRAFEAREAQGLWKLRIEDDNEGDTGTVFCWQLEISRAVLETRSTRSGRVRAELSFREIGQTVTDVLLKIYRAGKLVFEGAQVGCPGCERRPASGKPVTARDLDGDREPEVLVDLYSGGAHCCTYTLLYRYEAKRKAYRRLFHSWGNAGYRVRDLDRDGRPELVSGDDRFAYTFTSYASSVDPLQIWSYRAGKLTDVTRSFPAALRRDAGRLWLAYVRDRTERDADVRGVLAAYLAERVLLGEGAEAWKQLHEVLSRGELTPPDAAGVGPTGGAYLKALRAFLVRSGYLSSAEARAELPL